MDKHTNTVEAELISATNTSPKPKEPRKTFLKRLNKAVNSMADADEGFWDSLSEEAQQWVNDGNDAVSYGTDIPDLASSSEEATGETTDTDPTPAKKPEKKAVPAKGKKEASPAKPVKPVKQVKPKVPKAAKTGKFETIMRAVLKHPNKSASDLVALLPDIAPASVVSVHGDLRRTVRLLHSMGLMEKNPF